MAEQAKETLFDAILGFVFSVHYALFNNYSPNL